MKEEILQIATQEHVHLPQDLSINFINSVVGRRYNYTRLKSKTKIRTHKQTRRRGRMRGRGRREEREGMERWEAGSEERTDEGRRSKEQDVFALMIIHRAAAPPTCFLTPGTRRRRRTPLSIL